jgi:hypothetical protein
MYKNCGISCGMYKSCGCSLCLSLELSLEKILVASLESARARALVASPINFFKQERYRESESERASKRERERHRERQDLGRLAYQLTSREGQRE